MRRKGILLLLCSILVLCLVACGKEKTDTGASSEITVETEKKEVASGVTEKTENTTNDLIPEDYAAAIIVTINPQVKLYVDINNTIVGIEYLNEDAKTAYAGIDFLGAAVEEGMEKLIDAAVEKEFLTDGKEVSIDIAEVKDDGCDCTAVCAKAEAVAVEAIQNCQIEAVVTAQVSAPEVAEAAEQTKEQTISQAEPQEKPQAEQQTGAEAAQEEAPMEETPMEEAPMEEAPIEEASIEEAPVSVNVCSNCGGTGKCDECKGDGKLGKGFKVSCPRCHGSLTETCIYCDAAGNSLKHAGTCDFPNCMGSHVYACTTCNGGSTSVTCASCNGSGKCKVCGGSGTK